MGETHGRRRKFEDTTEPASEPIIAQLPDECQVDVGVLRESPQQLVLPNVAAAQIPIGYLRGDPQYARSSGCG
jgi:hypothetical protein